MKRIIAFILLITMLVSMVVSFAHADEMETQSNKVVCLGKDLAESHKDDMLKSFGVDKDDEDLKIIEITIDEEKEYLGRYIEPSVLGSRSISSVYVELMEEGYGIDVDTQNITWVTEYMIQNALVTAGVKDAKVMVNAPFPVSGTAALTGVIKAFESATGEEIGDEEKDTATAEIAITAELGDSVGKGKAEELITLVKTDVVDKKLKDESKIRKVIINAAKQLDIELTEEEIDRLVDLMKRISNLNLDIDQIKEQIKGIQEKLDVLQEHTSKIMQFLQKIWDFLTGLFGGNKKGDN